MLNIRVTHTHIFSAENIEYSVNIILVVTHLFLRLQINLSYINFTASNTNRKKNTNFTL